MKLVHYSKHPLVEKRDRQVDADLCGAYKPTGLWVSVVGKDDWRSWCEAERYYDCDGMFETEIKLTGLGKPVLHLKNDVEIYDFGRKYEKDLLHRVRSMKGIDWKKVGEEYGGLIIAPYSWHHSYESDWYYGWDCASGCFWSADVWEIGSSVGGVKFKEEVS